MRHILEYLSPSAPRSRRPSAALVVSCIALFVALGGSSYAAIAISKNSIQSKHIAGGQVKRSDLARNGVTSAKIKDFSLLANDFKRGELPAGPKGDPGPVGPRGPKGDAGPAAELPPQERYRVVGSQGAPSFFNGGEGDCVWKNLPGFSPASFQKDALGRVHLRGVVFGEPGTGGDGKCDPTQPGEGEDGIVFSLPKGYRPEYVTVSAATAQIAIVPDQGAVLSDAPIPPGAIFSANTSVAGFDDASFLAASAATTAQQAKPAAKLSLNALRAAAG